MVTTQAAPGSDHASPASTNPTLYVAHEFVRQYYTMLHKDPSQLHRFYTKESKLTHGGTPNAKCDEAITGQEAISEKIRELNYLDTYAKIRSVDSHPTLGQGVVIQVTGELSNSSSPMRKFMQTFVLQRQSAKKYSVYNDIFRYQDEIFETEEENEETNDGTFDSVYEVVAQEQTTSVGQMDPVPDVSARIYDQPEVALREEAFETKNHFESEQQYINKNYELANKYQNNTEYEYDYNSNAYAHASENIASPLDNLSLNPPVAEEKLVISSIEEGDGAFSSDPDDELNDSTEENKEVLPAVNENETAEFENVGEQVAEIPAELEENDEPNKPVTWAALAKKNTPVTHVTSPTNAPVKKAASNPVSVKSAPAIVPQVQRRPQDDTPTPTSTNDDQKNFSSRRGPPPPDSHQVFIGNLPNGVEEEEIKEIFSEFGKIVEVRLNPKNFGFVAFDNADSPGSVINKSRQITCKGQKINIEAKQANGLSRSGRGGGPRREGRGGGPRNEGSQNDSVGGRGGGNGRGGRGAGQSGRGGRFQTGGFRSNGNSRENSRGGGQFNGPQR